MTAKKSASKKRKVRIALFVKVERWHERDKVWDVSFRAPTKKELKELLEGMK
jgi:hypothetical protein